MLEVKEIYKHYTKAGAWLRKDRHQVLKGVSFSVRQGDCVGLVGESGSGKSTLSRIIMGLEAPDQGEVLMEGEAVNLWKKKHRGQMSVVFQDYTTSVNSRFQVSDILAEPLQGSAKKQQEAKIRSLLEKVELSTQLLTRYPHELSGGQLQRVCLARAISTEPKFLVLDEALSSLDVSIQAQMLGLLRRLKQEFHLTYLFIAHDLQTITNLCDQVLFLYQGTIVEKIPSAKLYCAKNDYAKRLLQSVVAFDG
ncbi:dipeptide/oligopeptide/nickel ABC transporter ATP-binding protein [uncultured Anaeromusa sp.]|uniref:ABC transporter ATP-binding protein n=1 Tax=uncultured Anaeromusa sp. TaxID=673273 RepID=UPI0029C705D7|nr:dipeptide/oligopeptide/nickel ABC transporter ATP-binding protein [uncultured Anaeromusa sp.]